MLMGLKKYQSGDPCPNCPTGILVVVQTNAAGNYRIRYLGCRTCNTRPDNNKLVPVPIEYAPKRKQRPEGRT